MQMPRSFWLLQYQNLLESSASSAGSRRTTPASFLNSRRSLWSPFRLWEETSTGGSRKISPHGRSTNLHYEKSRLLHEGYPVGKFGDPGKVRSFFFYFLIQITLLLHVLLLLQLYIKTFLLARSTLIIRFYLDSKGQIFGVI